MYSCVSLLNASGGNATPKVNPPHETVENSPSPVMVPLVSSLAKKVIPVTGSV
jgi:hypothetical protein